MGRTSNLSSQVTERLVERLAALPGLPLPAQLRSLGPADASRVSAHLASLLAHDPGVFLERYGGLLTPAERAEFEGLRGDYEVNFWLSQLEDAADAGKAAARAKNRRHAQMNRLLAEGRYFSEGGMRERQPALHHQYIGQFRPPEAPRADACVAGQVLADSIMAQQQELELLQRSAAEQQRWRDAESEDETDSEGEGGEGEGRQQGAAAAAAAPPEQPPQPQHPQGGGGGAAGGAAAAPGTAGGEEGMADGAGEVGAGEGAGEGPAYVRISEEEAAANAEALLDAMKQRFLAGQDAGVDYAAIDADSELDEDWAKERGQDAEDSYFSGDD